VHSLTAFSLAQLLIRNTRKKNNHSTVVTLGTPNRAEIKKNTGKRKWYQQME